MRQTISFIFRLPLGAIVRDPIRRRLSMIRPSATVLLGALGLALAACAGEVAAPEQPTFYRSMASPVAELDGAAAASMISGYRQNNGLGPVALDPALMQMAQAQAQAMAARDKVGNDSKGEFARRMKSEEH